MNSAAISSLPNSTESVFVVADCSGVVNLPFGNPTHSFEPSSRVLANTTATYGGLSWLDSPYKLPASDKPKRVTKSSFGNLWNVLDTSTGPFEIAISATLFEPYARSNVCSRVTVISCK